MLRVGRRKAKYTYNITLHEPYRFESPAFPKPNSDLSRKIAEAKAESKLQVGATDTLSRM